MKALRIPADDAVRYEVEGITPDLLKKAIGGWLEGIGGVDHADRPWFAYLDEEGKLKRLEPNWRATWLAMRLGWRGDVLVGPVVFVGPPDAEGDDTDVPEFVLEAMGHKS